MKVQVLHVLEDVNNLSSEQAEAELKRKMRTISVSKGSHHMLASNRHLSLSAKMNRTEKEDTGKSMKNALHVLRYAKRHLSGRSDVEQ